MQCVTIGDRCSFTKLSTCFIHFTYGTKYFCTWRQFYLILLYLRPSTCFTYFTDCDCTDYSCTWRECGVSLSASVAGGECIFICTSAYVSIRQHTSAYVSMRVAGGECIFTCECAPYITYSRTYVC